MNKYLLLRNNKQSGPFTVEELISHGLKPYDLVWLEGKSAAWRYPSEVEELKAFAPAVEEQPFDRFYKKPAANESSQKVEVKEVPQPAKREEKPTLATVPVNSEVERPIETRSLPKNRKVYVTFPGAVNATPVEKPVVQPKAEPVAEVQKEVHNIPASLPSNHSNYYPSQKDHLTIPVVNTSDIKQSTSPFEEQSFEERYREERKMTGYKEASRKIPVSNKFWIRTMAAACLVLAGVLLGFILNYNRQKSDIQELNELVKQIKQKENAATITPPVVYKPEPVIETPKEIIQEEKKPVKKEAKSKVSEKPADTVQPETIVAAEPAEMPNAMPGTGRPVYKRESSPEESEVARKNLYQLVSVDHNKYKTGVFGGVSNLQLKLSNKSLYQLDKVEVEVKYYGPEKKLVNTQVVYFENISAGEQLTLDVPKSTRGITIDYSIKKIDTKDPSLAHGGQ